MGRFSLFAFSAWRALGSRVIGFFRGGGPEADLEVELRTHLDALTEENIRRGMAPEEARYAARREFGGIEQTKLLLREQRGLPFIDAFAQDARFAARMMAKNVGFTIIVVLTLAAGIGVTSAVFSVVDRILFRALPYPQDDRLVSFGVVAPFESIEFMLAPEYEVWRLQPGPFAAMTSLTPGGADCELTEQSPLRLRCALVESTFLSTLGIHPVVGRDFTRADDRPKAPRVALLSYGLWQSRFGGDPKVVDRFLMLDGKRVTIAGVLPRNFEMPNLDTPDVLMPQALDLAAMDRNHPQVLLRTFARLRPGVSVKQAAAALQPAFQDSLRFVPPQFRREVTLRVRSLRDRQIGDSRIVAWLLFASVGAVLLLACTNVANLLLVRTVGRQRELAMRAALGATRGRLARQALTESVVLGVMGGATGCALGYILLRIFLAIAPEGIARLREASMDVRVLAFMLAVSLFSGIIFGIAPALAPARAEALAGKIARSATRGFFRHALVAAQIAASMVLLAGAGLLLRTLHNLESVPLGLDTEHVVFAQVALAEYKYPDTRRQIAFFNQVEERVRALPGINAIALSDTLPPSGGMQATFLASIEIPGHPKFAQGTGGMVGWRAVTPQYFSALSIPILRGRGFADEDGKPASDSVILSDALAQKLFPAGQEPLGKLLHFTAFDRQGPWRKIVGIAGNVKNNGLTASGDPEFYIPWKDDPEIYARAGYLILRTPLSVNSIIPWVRAAVAEVDATTPVQFSSMSERVGKLTARPRFDAILLALFAATGLVLAAIGLYGVVSFFVSQRTQEIGIRMALGASPHRVMKAVVWNTARWILAGALLGLAGAWVCARFVASLLFGVRAHDPALLALSFFLLVGVAILAAWIPARRAASVDPVIALRHE